MAHDHGRTERLDLADATLREWDAVVLDVDDDGLVLDRSAFYPGGGGQPPDFGVLLEDATHQAGPDFLQRAAVYNIETFFGWVTSTSEFCHAFAAG